VQPSRAGLSRTRIEALVPWVAALAVALPVLAHRYPAMLDLPGHEEIVAAMRYHGDRVRYPAGLMAWNLGHPNQLFYFLACALSYLVPVAMACKVVIAGAAAGVPLGAARLADHVGVSRWVALGAAPIGLGFLFYFGMVGNLLALGLVLAVLPVLDGLALSPTAGRSACATGLMLVLYVAHDGGLLVAAIALVVLSIGQPLAAGAVACRVAPLVVSGSVALFEQMYAMANAGPNLRAVPRVIDLTLERKLGTMPESLLGLHGQASTQAAFFAIAAAIALLAVQRISSRPFGARSHGIAWVVDHRFECVGAALCIGYFVVPFAYGGAMWLHARFLAAGVPVLAVAAAPRLPVRPWPGARVVAAAAVALTLALVLPDLAATSRACADLEPLLALVQPGSAIAPVDVGGTPAKHLVMTAAGAGARAAAERGGRVAASFTQTSPIPPVIVAPAHRWEDSLLRLSRDTLALEPARDLHLFRYVLAWTREGQQGALEQALSPEARLVARSGGWLLFESTLSLDPVLAPEPVRPAAETLRARLGSQSRR
jgi:hypothetical protein